MISIALGQALKFALWRPSLWEEEEGAPAASQLSGDVGVDSLAGSLVLSTIVSLFQPHSFHSQNHQFSPDLAPELKSIESRHAVP